MTQPMQFFDPPPLRWTGSKWQLSEWIISHFPPHELYCEPYCGGAAVFFRKPPAKIEVLNDVDGAVVNFFTVLRTRTAELVQAVQFTPYARAEYELAYEPSSDPLEAARRFYICSRQSFGAYAGRKTGWRTQKNGNRGTSITSEWKRMGGLLKAANRLRDAQIECDDALKVIQSYDTPRALFYVDPPYVLSARSQGRKRKRYTFEMTDDDHRALAEVLHQVRGMVLLSGYDSPLYRELYADWKVVSKSTTTNGNGSAMEYLWISPHAAAATAQLELWDILLKIIREIQTMPVQLSFI